LIRLWWSTDLGHILKLWSVLSLHVSFIIPLEKKHNISLSRQETSIRNKSSSYQSNLMAAAHLTRRMLRTSYELNLNKKKDVQSCSCTVCFAQIYTRFWFHLILFMMVCILGMLSWCIMKAYAITLTNTICYAVGMQHMRVCLDQISHFLNPFLFT